MFIILDFVEDIFSPVKRKLLLLLAARLWKDKIHPETNMTMERQPFEDDVHGCFQK